MTERDAAQNGRDEAGKRGMQEREKGNDEIKERNEEEGDSRVPIVSSVRESVRIRHVPPH
jgi:hypothetical protein